ncbi:MAG: sulfatase-like hydrolase/transferase [Planctomycetaceae bacterium]
MPAESRVALLLIVLWCSCAVGDDGEVGRPPRRPRSPNVVLLIADDLGYGELGCQGNVEIPTPHIDSIAAAGVRFTNAYVTAPYCSASRAGLFSGRYQTRFGYEFNPIGQHNEDPRVGLPAAEVTLAERLREAGFATGLVGKWHLGGTAAYHPLRHGFDEFFGFLHEGHSYAPIDAREITTMLRRRRLPPGCVGRWMSGDGSLVLTDHMGHDEPAYDANNPIERNGQPVEERDYLTDAFTREAVDFIGRHRERPFFLCVAYNAVHSPLQARDADVEVLDGITDIHRRLFAAMLLRLDSSVGAILDELRDQDLRDETLVMFISDNGGPTRELTSSNYPLRGEKGSLSRGDSRPCLLQWPARLPAARVEHLPIISLDLYATAVSAATGRHLDAARTDGIDLLPFLSGAAPQPPPRTLFWRDRQQAAVRVGEWKAIRAPSRGEAAEWELYHLADDPGESRNLAESESDRLMELLRQYGSYQEQMREPLWRPGS